MVWCGWEALSLDVLTPEQGQVLQLVFKEIVFKEIYKKGVLVTQGQ